MMLPANQDQTQYPYKGHTKYVTRVALWIIATIDAVRCQNRAGEHVRYNRYRFTVAGCEALCQGPPTEENARKKMPAKEKEKAR